MKGKTIGIGGGGKVRAYYSEKFGRYVVEKTVGQNYVKFKDINKTRLTTLLSNNAKSEDLLKKESIFMILTNIGKLDCCVEVLDFGTNPFSIIMEYCEGGDLRNILDNYDVPIADKVVMIGQILEALVKIHQFGIIHGDLKCQNIFLTKKYKPGHINDIRIKIGDFGLSELGGDLVFGGTIGFMAPEVPSIGGSFEADIYSIGKVMLEIMTGLPPSIIAAINNGNLNSIKYKLPKFLNSTEFYELIVPCLYNDFTKRPIAEDLLQNYNILFSIWLIYEKLNSLILMKYKIGDKIPVDSHEHSLILSNSQMRTYQDKWYCSICNNSDKPFPNNYYSFHCPTCEYDLCGKCIEEHDYRIVNDKMSKRVKKGQKVYVAQHKHHLTLCGYEERKYPMNDSCWLCDICKVNASHYVNSFHCKKCEYDVCLNCYGKYSEIRDNCSCNIF